MACPAQNMHLNLRAEENYNCCFELLRHLDQLLMMSTTPLYEERFSRLRCKPGLH